MKTSLDFPFFSYNVFFFLLASILLSGEQTERVLKFALEVHLQQSLARHVKNLMNVPVR